MVAVSADVQSAIDIAGNLAINMNSEQTALLQRLLSFMERSKEPTLQQYIYTFSPTSTTRNVLITSPGPSKISKLYVLGYNVTIAGTIVVFDRIIGNSRFAVDGMALITNGPMVMENILVPSVVQGNITIQGTFTTGEITVIIVLEHLEQSGNGNGR